MEGTGKGCQPEWLYVAGKTGTVQIASKKTMQTVEGELEEMLQDHAWLATYGGLESDNPGLAVLVFIEHGGKEGTIAKLKIVRQIYSLYYPNLTTGVDGE